MCVYVVSIPEPHTSTACSEGNGGGGQGPLPHAKCPPLAGPPLAGLYGHAQKKHRHRKGEGGGGANAPHFLDRT